MRVFNTQEELDSANERWRIARHSAWIEDMKMWVPVIPEITQKWSDWRQMIDGRIACETPTQWAEEFGGIELELTESDFPINNS